MSSAGDIDVEAIHAGERVATLQAIGAQAAELDAQDADATVTCPCGQTVPLRRAYQCRWCDVHFCRVCAAEHFGPPPDWWDGPGGDR